MKNMLSLKLKNLFINAQTWVRLETKFILNVSRTSFIIQDKSFQGGCSCSSGVPTKSCGVKYTLLHSRSLQFA